jgi:hypothetical protein
MCAETIRRILSIFLVLGWLVQPASGLAADTSASAASTERALVRGNAALELYRTGAWIGAHAAFSEAEALAHSPVFVLYMARSLRNAGRWLEARKLFASLAHERITADSPQAWRDAVTEGDDELRQLSARIPRLRLRFLPRRAEELSVEVDGVSLSIPQLADAIELDPGRHVVTTKLDGATRQAKAFLVSDLGGETVVVLKGDGGPTGAPPARVTQATPRATLPRDSSPVAWERAAGFGAASLGIVAIGFGAVAGWLAVDQAQDLRSRCDRNDCPADSVGDRDRARRLGNLSTAGFVVGGVALVAGGTLLIVRPFAEPNDRTGVARLGLTCAGTM